MHQVPCEYIHWYGLPAIRKEIAKSMITNFGLNQKEAACKLGVTPAAICQYFSKKRGNVNIIDEKIRGEITKSAEIIVNNGSSAVTSETCRICKILRSEGLDKFHFEKWYLSFGSVLICGVKFEVLFINDGSTVSIKDGREKFGAEF